MKQITNSIQKVIARGRIDPEGNRQDWSAQDQSLEALTQNESVPVMVSPFEKAVIEQLAEEWKDIVNNKGKSSNSRTGRVLLRQALGLAN